MTKGKWYLRAVTSQTVDIEGLAEHMSSHNSPYSKGLIQGLLTDMVACIKELMLDGKAVKIGDLAIFSIGIKSNGADKAEEAKVSLVTGYRFKARATGEMAVSELKSDIQLRELKHYTGGEPLDADLDGDPDDSPEGDNQGGPGNEGESEQPVKYTATFKHLGSTLEEKEYALGETIVAPSAPSGYEWEDYPVRMPARDITVNSELIGGGGGSGF